MKKALSIAVIAALVAASAPSANARTIIVEDDYPVQYMQTRTTYIQENPFVYGGRPVYYSDNSENYYGGGPDYNAGYSTDPFAPILAVTAVAAAVGLGVAAIAGSRGHKWGGRQNSHGWNNNHGHNRNWH